ncbi:MAG TPA: glycoside hydrolase family 76 protein [Trebonia sp.]|nr:glycoside hydrolase family 76 protein [Trebonia sp.]
MWAQRAQASYDALQKYLYLGPLQNGLYLEDYPFQAGDNNYSYLWTITEAENAAIDMAGTPGGAPVYSAQVSSDTAAIGLYASDSPTLPDGGTNATAPNPAYESYLPAPLGTSGDAYYDDNSVLALTYVSRYEQDKDPAALKSAKQTFAFVEQAWDSNSSDVCAGGMKWVDASWNTIRAANVTGLAAQVAAHLYELTKDSSYLNWAVKLYDWNAQCLQQSPGLYSNSITYTGTVDPTLWSYNSGFMIAAAALLYRATGDKTWLDKAVADANGAVSYWTTGGADSTQPAIFNAMFFQDLLLLDSISPHAAYVQAVSQYAELAWDNFRNPATGLFQLQASGGGPYDPTARPQTLEQSGMVQIFAALAWPKGRYGDIA